MTDDDAIRMTDDLDVVVRRSPRYGAFMVAGLILGFIVAGILVMLPVDTSQLTADYSMGASMGLLMMLLGIVGLGLGGAVALILDRINAKKAKQYTVRAEYTARRPASPSVNGTAPGWSPDKQEGAADRPDTDSTIAPDVED